ncbi:hypothetical protein GCM10010992_21880 [Cloacibacterium rupense]|uniref:Glycosyl hydrolase family 13 catalytic domain-containing protein n=2 Tax=Cloacibacterium rupense TaxID=517423 RepID=A0ABQ2NN42_9FLAO|nr:hypothetical protein GCM10010992_21880 [Cloacibacterium rupense]
MNMKNFYTFLLSFLVNIIVFSQQQQVTYSIAPSVFEENTSITITINGNSINESAWGVTNNTLYMWAWAFDTNDTTQKGTPLNGTWNSSDEAAKFTYNAGNDTYTKTITPTTYYNTTGIGRIGFLIKAKDGTGDKKSQDILAEVGAFQVTLTAPSENSTTILASGGNLNITATNSNGVANYNLKSNGVSINTANATSTYSFNHTNITGNQNYELEVIQGTTTIVKKFSAVVSPNVVSEAIPAGLVNGINYNQSDATKATLVLDAPGKDFVYVAGSFNNWQPTAAYAMKKDATSGSTKFWLELTGLTSGTNYTYQYWVVDQTPLAGSPSLVKAADPFSTLVLSPFDDPGIPATTYPSLPAYPTGQEREVTVLKTGEAAYPWKVSNFTKPEKEKLVIYELLVRDFDAKRNFQDIINRIDYFKNLGINAIQLMPIMEYEGNESWGYNTSFHMALDKFYGTKDKLKELVDICHQNGIAVILDVALNHAFGRNSLVRMWMNDPDGDGWGSPSTENPYFNTIAKHSYSVGEDFNHSSSYTKNYVKQVVKHWINEYKIDGFRWDLTKGFTQNCTASDESCTNQYQQDRVDILKEYADFSWSVDSNHYVIFEHLGTDAEEKEWANFKVNEGKGVMLWGKMTDEYNELTMGWSNKNLSRTTSTSRGFAKNRLIAYPESHDEERLMYKNLQFGNSSNASHNVKNLDVALSRMPALGAVSILVPGPKMLWHFGELGMENSIFTCTDGTVNTSSDATTGDCKLSTKPQPQWTNNWLADAKRKKIYDDWSKMINLKKTEAVFDGSATISSANTNTPNIKVTNSTLSPSQLKDVLIISNFDVVAKDIATGFPYTGTWYNLMDNTAYNVTDANQTINLQPGEYRVFGNQMATGGQGYSISSKNASCGADDGQIILTVNKTADYQAKITGTNYNQTITFNTTTTVSNLAAGAYNVCVSTVGNNDEKCTAITVSKDEIAAPTGNASQTLLPNATLAQLNVTGSAIKWYAAASGGNSLPTTTILVNNQTYYASQTINGCESKNRLAVKAVIDYNNFSITTKSETCSGKNNGEIEISANLSYSYVAKITGTNYNQTLNFTNNKLNVTSLVPGTYEVCVEVAAINFKQCFNVTISKGVTASARISANTSSNSIDIIVEKGTAPYKVLINGIQKFETNDTLINVSANQGDLVELKTAVSCEGSVSHRITGLSKGSSAFPNPTKGEFNVSVNSDQKQVELEIYNTEGKLVSKQKYYISNGLIKADLTRFPNGIYIAKVLLNQPIIIKIIKE